MRAVLASPRLLGVTIFTVALACGGCNQRPITTASAVQTAPLVDDADEPSGLAARPTTAPVAESSVKVTPTDVINWAGRGVADDVIVDRIDHSRATFRLSAGEEMRLRDAGVSDQVVLAMKATVWN